MESTRAQSPWVIDLHTHSTCSDGTQPPAEVVRAARTADVDVLALTDHDAVSGWADAAAAGLQVGVSVIPGVELSTQIAGVSVHLLAYLIDAEHPGMINLMGSIRRHRLTSMRHTVQLLAADGYPVDCDEILAHGGSDATYGRPHVADALVRASVFPDRSTAFADLLHSRSPYQMRCQAPRTDDVIAMVLAAGGVPVIAHPFAHLRGHTVSERTITSLAHAGLAGVEVWHRDHDESGVAAALALARREDLIATGSSDYHGEGKPNRLAEYTTPPADLQRILDLATGSGPLGAALPEGLLSPTTVQ